MPAKPTTPIPRCVFICSPFSADNDADLFRNIEYAQDASKDAIDRGLEVDLETGLQIERMLFASMFATEDRALGMRSFIESGPGKAEFTGR